MTNRFFTQLIRHTLAATIIVITPGRVWAAETVSMDIKPRLCTLGEGDTHCRTPVHVVWNAEQEQNACVDFQLFPEVTQCWQDSRSGEVHVELEFDEDLIVSLRDRDSNNILLERTITLVREAVRYRRKRRQPWNIFY